MPENATTKHTLMILAILTLGSFSFGMAEFFTIWFSPTIALELNTTVNHVATAASYYALGVMAGIPLLTCLIKRISHQRLLVLLLFWCFLGNIATSFIHSWEQLRWTRFASGMPHGMYFGIASMVLIQMLPSKRQGLGLGILMSGIGLALLLVIPISIYLEQYQNWRLIVRAVGLLDLLVIVLLHDLLNDAAPPPDTQLQTHLLHAFKNPFLWWVLTIGIMVLCGRMAIFAYAETIIVQITHFLSKQHLPLVILASGIGTFTGFILGGWLADKHLHNTIIFSLLYALATIATFDWMAQRSASLYVAFVLLGACTMLLPALQLLIIRTCPQAPTFASCLNHGALNIGNALGPLLAAFFIASGWGILSITWIGIVCSLMALLLFLGFQNKASDFIKQHHSNT